MEQAWIRVAGFVKRTLSASRPAIALLLLALLPVVSLVFSALVEDISRQARARQVQDIVLGPGGMPAHVPFPGASGSPPALPVATDDLNLLLLGSDRRTGGDPSWRTDVIMIAAIRPQARVVGLFSIPRDLWVSIPDYGEDRINVVDCLGERTTGKGGGPRLLAATLERNLGIPVRGYVRIDFQGLERIVDAVGGIDIDVDRAYDQWLDLGTPGYWHLQLTPGPQHMDGRTALGYARYRLQTSDLDRCRREQQILLALRASALRPSTLPRLPQLLEALADAVDTDLTLRQALALVGLARQIDGASFRTCVFAATMVRDWVTPGGAMVLLPDRARIAQAWAALTAAGP